MERTFGASSVAVIGASDREGNLGRNILRNLKAWEYGGRIYAVNPRGGEAEGFRLYPSISELPEAVDLAVAIIPAQHVPAAMEECGKKGIRRMAIPSGGFDEFDSGGEGLTLTIKEIAGRYGIRFVGPNCLTVINSHTGLCLPFIPMERLPVGGVSIVAQSGGIGMDFLVRLRDENLGFSKFASMGNKADLDEVDFLRYLGEDETTDVICLYLEDVARGREFLEIAEGITKPILCYKSNVATLSQRSAQSHTAALANDDEILDAAFRQAGIVRVNRLRELAGFSKVFKLPPLRGNRIALVSPTGGVLVLASDVCARHGFEFPHLSEELKADIQEKLRAGVIRIDNPVDLGDVHDSDARLYIIQRLMEQDYIDGVILIMFATMAQGGQVAGGSIPGLRKSIIPELPDLVRQYDKPVICSLITDDRTRQAARASTGLPVFADAEESVEAAAILRDATLFAERKGSSL
jgi:acyl-CoA synthetase (NDP forming)